MTKVSGILRCHSPQRIIKLRWKMKLFYYFFALVCILIAQFVQCKSKIIAFFCLFFKKEFCKKKPHLFLQAMNQFLSKESMLLFNRSKVWIFFRHNPYIIQNWLFFTGDAKYSITNSIFSMQTARLLLDMFDAIDQHVPWVTIKKETSELDNYLRWYSPESLAIVADIKVQ